MKKLLLTTALVAGFAGTASAGDVNVSFGGYSNTQFAHQDQSTGFNDSSHGHGIVNDTNLHVKVDGKAGNGLKYGGLVELNADTSANKLGKTENASKTMAYVETMFGRFEAGSTEGVYNAMKVDGSSVARATGGIDGDAQYWWNSTHAGKFLVKPHMPTNYDTQGESHAAKLNFVSPSYSGFKVGLTYVPDTEQKGTVNGFHGVDKDQAGATADATKGYKNVFSGGVHYAGKMDKLGLKAALLAERGTAKDTTAPAKRKDLRAWELGGSVNMSGMTLAASYGNWGKSGQLKTSTGKTGSKYWTLGASYEHGAVGVSATYISSEKGGNTFVRTNEATNFSLGLDYKLAPGFMPYAEVSMFEQKERSAASGNAKNKGTIFLAGTKLSF